MNGSGNLLVKCTGPNGSVVELHFGNGTFDGPRTYKADDFSSDGRVSYQPDEQAPTDSSGEEGSSCSLVLTQAPVDASGSSVPKGSVIASTFTCTPLRSAGDRGPLAIEEGDLLVTLE
jgi:hypothetical protein